MALRSRTERNFMLQYINMKLFIDRFLNNITMYRLVFYGLLALWLAGFCLAALDLLPFEPFDAAISLLVVFCCSVAANWIFEKVFSAPSNPESTYITALILALITGPETAGAGWWRMALVSVVAVGSKYLLAYNKKHIFNPAALAIVLAPYLFSYYPSWWIGDWRMALPVSVVGLLVVRKLQRMDLVASFLITYVIVSFGFSGAAWQQPLASLKDLVAYSPVLFFAFIMLTEPATTPPTQRKRLWYGVLVGALQSPLVHVGAWYFSPELALAASNIVAFLVSPKQKLVATLVEKKLVAAHTYDFMFSVQKRFSFKPGQYMEWTLPHNARDARGMRRYFTLASSPTEDRLAIGVKFYDKPSSYKKALLQLPLNSTMVAAQLAGDFTLPDDPARKLVFFAGGIGITPFRSMVKYLLDKGERRDIVIFYAANSYKDIAYRDVFDRAAEALGIKTVYVLGSSEGTPAGFAHEIGFVSKDMLSRYVTDLPSRLCYISGPKAMIDSFREMLGRMGVPRRRIKTDFFPGYA